MVGNYRAFADILGLKWIDAIGELVASLYRYNIARANRVFLEEAAYPRPLAEEVAGAAIGVIDGDVRDDRLAESYDLQDKRLCSGPVAEGVAIDLGRKEVMMPTDVYVVVLEIARRYCEQSLAVADIALMAVRPSSGWLHRDGTIRGFAGC